MSRVHDQDTIVIISYFDTRSNVEVIYRRVQVSIFPPAVGRGSYDEEQIYDLFSYTNDRERGLRLWLVFRIPLF